MLATLGPSPAWAGVTQRTLPHLILSVVYKEYIMNTSRIISSFSNPKVRDKNQPQQPVPNKSGIGFRMLHPFANPVQYHTDSLKVLFIVEDESITPPAQLSKAVLQSMAKADTKVSINVDQVYATRNTKFTHFRNDDGDLCVIANYSKPYQGIAVSIPC